MSISLVKFRKNDFVIYALLSTNKYIIRLLPAIKFNESIESSPQTRGKMTTSLSPNKSQTITASQK